MILNVRRTRVLLTFITCLTLKNAWLLLLLMASLFSTWSVCRYVQKRSSQPFCITRGQLSGTITLQIFKCNQYMYQKIRIIITIIIIIIIITIMITSFIQQVIIQTSIPLYSHESKTRHTSKNLN